MKLAFLIAAHTDLDELIRLCEKLKSYGDTYVHVDIKVNESYMRTLKCSVKKMDGEFSTYILEKRVYVTWGGYSQLYCQRLLLEAALNSNKDYDRLFYISGLDYPICSPKELDEYCLRNRDRELIKAYNIRNGCDKNLKSRVCLYHFFRDIHLPHKSFLRRAIIGGTKLLLKYIGLRKKAYVIIEDKKWDVFVSSQWVGMTMKCAEYVLENLYNNHKLISYFKTSYAPDELIVPTIIFNSDFKCKAYETNDPSFSGLAMLHYLNMTDHVWSYDEGDYYKIMESGKLFVRKVVSNKSEKLIDLINKKHRCE